LGARFADVVNCDRFVTDLSALNRVWAEFFRDAKPATTTVQAVRLANRSTLPGRDQCCRGDRLEPTRQRRTLAMLELLTAR
jgi:enamine deaminase RidA (YjgF/YER057c/UK114 family)